MSHRATNWAIEVVKGRGLRPAAKLVLFHLADRHNKDTGRCDPSQELLAADCEVSRSSLNDQLDILEADGLIRRARRVDPATNRKVSTYYILGLDFDDAQKPCPKIGQGAVSENEPEPCPKNAESRVRNSDINPVREPGREPARVKVTQSDCDRFKAAYPANGSVSYTWANLPIALGRHVLRLGSVDRVIGAAKAYAEHVTKHDTKPRGLGNFLADPAFVDQWADSAASVPAPETPDQWRRRVEFYRQHGQWHAPGPNPGQPGCMAPDDVVAQFGYRKGTA